MLAMNLAELAAIVSDEEKAFEIVERLRWPNGATCPHCGVVGRANKLPAQRTKASEKHPEGKPVHGLWKCYACRKQFTVRVGSIFEDSPIPLGKWLLAIHLMCSSKKGISSNQLKRELGVSYQTRLVPYAPRPLRNDG
jgi:transposase-like protein